MKFKKQYLVGLDLSPVNKHSVMTLAEFEGGFFIHLRHQVIQGTNLSERSVEVKRYFSEWAKDYNFIIDDVMRWQLDFIDFFKCDLIFKVSTKYGNKNI